MDKPIESETLTITLINLPKGTKAWLAREGKPHYRNDVKEAASRCAEYLIQAYKRAVKAETNGTPAEVING